MAIFKELEGANRAIKGENRGIGEANQKGENRAIRGAKQSYWRHMRSIRSNGTQRRTVERVKGGKKLIYA